MTRNCFSGVEAGREAGADSRPLGVEDREIDRVALEAADVHVLAERALADGPEPRDRLLRADVAAVGLERDTHAAEGLEAIAQEEELRLGVGRSAPVFAAEKRRADLDLPIIGAHVEEARRADRAARRPPDRAEDNRLLPAHQVLGLANQRESLVERLWRRPREVATDLLV